MGAVVSAGLATLVELDTVLSVGDLYALIEILRVDACNRYLINKAHEA
ncbi:MAG: transcription elongation factor GreA [Alphaproteobacteria bacterium]|nr:transcription elongation factor GreA [Alphaproteobacteria bacterium]